jgi:Asp-tRNA(Asn)/Glu-tRNA(Gln) amidotransferase A subunit family amidase
VALALAERPASGLLHGVAIGLKDLIDTRDWPTGYGSPIYEGHRPDRDGWVVRAVQAQGGVPMGKLVTTEFGYFQPGPTANPGTPPARPAAPPAARPRRWPPAWCRWPSAPRPPAR